MNPQSKRDAVRERLARFKRPVKPTPKPIADKPIPAKAITKPVQVESDAPFKDTAGAKDKAIDRMAAQVLADLKAGTLVDHRSKQPLTKTISNRALGGYTTSSDSRKAILQNLEKRGVVEFRGGRAHIVESYLPAPESGPQQADIVSALMNLGKTRKESVDLATDSNGKTEAEWIKNALKKSLPVAS